MVARRQRGLSREELARRAGVSTRLVAEVERDQRPNVSLESVLRLLNIVGVSVVARAPDDASAEIRSESGVILERAARVAVRRQTWTGRHISLHDEGDEPRPVRSRSKRLASVAQLSEQAYRVASAAAKNVGVRPDRKLSRR